MSRSDNRERDKRANKGTLVGGITLAAVIALITGLLSMGGYLNDIRSIPKMKQDIYDQGKCQIKLETKMDYLLEDMGDIKLAVGARQRKRPQTGR